MGTEPSAPTLFEVRGDILRLGLAPYLSDGQLLQAVAALSEVLKRIGNSDRQFVKFTQCPEESDRALLRPNILGEALRPLEFAMSVEVSYPHIEKLEGSPARLRRLPRIRVAQIVIDYQNHGWSADEICIHYPHLKPAEVHSAMAYYYDHQSEIDGEIEEEQLRIEESRKNANPAPAEQRLRSHEAQRFVQPDR